MTRLTRTVRRRTPATVFERGQQRDVIVSLEPPAMLGFRLKGTRRTYYLSAGSCYDIALKAQLLAERKTKMAAKKGKGR